MSDIFHKDFTWGVSTSAYQIEGGWLSEGKGLSIWDAFCHIPNRIHNGDVGDVACDHINLYKRDVELLKELGVNAYRFSLSWPRILPEGKGTVNEKGIRFYLNLIDLLLENDIKPWITLYHWDLPLSLQMENDGWLNPDIADYFAEYSDVCFERFGDKVVNWITLNEPWVVAILGHGTGMMAPGRKSSREPLVVGHNLLRAHAKSVDIYNKNYRNTQKGRIGICINGNWKEPKTESSEDVSAGNRSLEFQIGWFADPVIFGDYPLSMKEKFGKQLPRFTDDEIRILKNSTDFLALNHYTAFFVENRSSNDANRDSFEENMLEDFENVIYSSDDKWQKTTMDWGVVPWGFSKLLHWMNKRYDRPEFIITENGAAFEDKLIDGQIHDNDRVEFLRSYIEEMKKAIKDGVLINGYFVWSLLDNFEWAFGFSKRFGLYYTDYESQERIPKNSAIWYSEFIKKNKP